MIILNLGWYFIQKLKQKYMEKLKDDGTKYFFISMQNFVILYNFNIFYDSKLLIAEPKGAVSEYHVYYHFP